jgi:hypothetical protein
MPPTAVVKRKRAGKGQAAARERVASSKKTASNGRGGPEGEVQACQFETELRRGGEEHGRTT